MVGSSGGGSSGVLAFIHPTVLLQSVQTAGTLRELPDADALGFGNGKGIERAFPRSEIDEVLWHTLLAQSLSDDFPICSFASQHIFNISTAVVLQVTNDAVHRIIRHHGQIRMD